MPISTVFAYKLLSRFGSCQLAFYCMLFIVGCVTVDLGEHKVSPEVESNQQAPYTQIHATISDTEDEAAQLVQALAERKIQVEFIDGTACYGDIFEEPNTQVLLNQLLQSDTLQGVEHCDLDLIIVVGKDYRKNETDLAVSIINYKEIEKSDTLYIHAEGNVRGLLPAPVPYLSLFYFKSTPDTEGSAIDALVTAIANKIEMEIDERPVQLLYLKSNNLPSIARLYASKPETRGDTSDDTELSRYNPLSFYVHMNKEAAEEGNPVVHNPIGQAMTLMISVMAVPAMIVLDMAFGNPDQTRPVGVKTVTPEEEAAIAGASEAIDRQDWEAGYRSLEGCINSKNTKIWGFCRYQINNHPELMEAARHTFSEEALRRSKAQHGDSALNIERQRLAVYERVAKKVDYASVCINMHKVFPNYVYISDWKLRKEVGTYCPNADLGHADAQRHIADIYYYGLYNAKQDLQRAYVWYSLAANGGDKVAEKRLGQVTSKFTPDELLKAQQLREQWEPGQCKQELFRYSIDDIPDAGIVDMTE